MKQAAMTVILALIAYVVYVYVTPPDRIVMLDKAKESTVQIINVHSVSSGKVNGGAGAIISEDGYIVTNHHVIADGKDRYVILNDHSLYEAKVIDSLEKADIALLKIEPKEKLPFFKFNQEPLKPGQLVYAIGSPFFLEQSISSGILSTLKRQSFDNSGTYYIQSNIACNPGNSGGPLLDSKGHLIGINSWVRADHGVPNPSLCFSVPDRVVQYITSHFIEKTQMRAKTIGAKYSNIDYYISKKIGFNKVIGVMVHEVEEGSPADEAGLQIGDVIFDYNNEEINSADELMTEVTLTPIGDAVPVEIWRSGEDNMEIQLNPIFEEDEGDTDKIEIDTTAE